MEDNICYVGFGSYRGESVSKKDALEYAMKKCGVIFTNEYIELDRKDFLHDFVPWYFSGSWTEEVVND